MHVEGTDDGAHRVSDAPLRVDQDEVRHSSSRLMAPVGQTRWHGARSQCRHLFGYDGRRHGPGLDVHPLFAARALVEGQRQPRVLVRVFDRARDLALQATDTPLRVDEHRRIVDTSARGPR